jgi:hypothetical protein
LCDLTFRSTRTPCGVRSLRSLRPQSAGHLCVRAHGGELRRAAVRGFGRRSCNSRGHLPALRPLHSAKVVPTASIEGFWFSEEWLGQRAWRSPPSEAVAQGRVAVRPHRAARAAARPSRWRARKRLNNIGLRAAVVSRTVAGMSASTGVRPNISFNADALRRAFASLPALSQGAG